MMRYLLTHQGRLWGGDVEGGVCLHDGGDGGGGVCHAQPERKAARGHGGSRQNLNAAKIMENVFLMICKLEINNKQYSFLWLWLIGQGHRMESGWTGNWEFVLCPLPAVCTGRYVNVSILTATYIHQDNIDQTAVLQIISASSILCALYTLNF